MDKPGLFLDHTTSFKYALNQQVECLRPYHVENTGSRPITEVKQRRARLVLGWVTAWEYRVLQTFAFFLQKYIFLFNLCFFLFLLRRTSIHFRILPSLSKCAHNCDCALQKKKQNETKPKIAALERSVKRYRYVYNSLFRFPTTETLVYSLRTCQPAWALDYGLQWLITKNNVGSCDGQAWFIFRPHHQL